MQRCFMRRRSGMKKMRRQNRTLLKTVFSIKPGVFLTEYFFSILYAILLAATPFFVEKLTMVVQMFDFKQSSAMGIFNALVLLLLIYILSDVCFAVSEYLGEKYASLSQYELYKRLNDKTGKLSAEFFEQKNGLEKVEKAYSGAYSVRSYIHTIMDIITMYLPYFVLYLTYLMKCSAFLAGLLIITFFPIFVGQKIKEKYYIELEDAMSNLRQREEQYAGYYAGIKSVKESRQLHCESFLENKLNETMQSMKSNQLYALKKNNKIDIIAYSLNLLGYLGLICTLVWMASNQQISVSEFVAIFASLRTFYDQLSELFGERIGELVEDKAKVKNFFSLVDMENDEYFEKDTWKPADIECVDLKHVSYSYPDGTCAVHDINCSLKKGDIIAIVGENGSGKTTLSKLITGVFRPSSGDIVITSEGGQKITNLREYSTELFQKFGRYELTLEENVTISHSFEFLTEKYEMAFADASFDEDELAEINTDTLLSREFGGIDLSGGQWQKIALARAIYRDKPVIVLDEPTAAIDPIKEGEMFLGFSRACKNRLGIIVTHRLGVVSICDKILVMKSGKMIDFGSHKELLNRCDYYKNMWELQAGLYL